jgi:nucleoside-diphosphate-sugar epimerase
MKIVIFGASGFIGSALYEALSIYHEIICVDKVVKRSHNFIECDLLKYDDTHEIFDQSIFANVDVVIHCAAILASTENHDNIQLLYDNLKISENIVKISKKLSPRSLINLSTIGVYPAIDGVYSEDSAIKPSSNHECLYSLSKFCSEELFCFFLKDSGIRVINLRLSQTIGRGMRSDRIYSIMLDELRNKNTITVWGKGERVSSFISIDYLLETIEKILKTQNLDGVYNVSQVCMSYLELAENILKDYGNEESKIILLEKGNKSKVYITAEKLNSLI